MVLPTTLMLKDVKRTKRQQLCVLKALNTVLLLSGVQQEYKMKAPFIFCNPLQSFTHTLYLHVFNARLCNVSSIFI